MERWLLNRHFYTDKRLTIMILTLTLNPAVDISMTVDRLIPEHKLHCSQPQYDAGGGGLNVSKAIRRLGGESMALFTCGSASGLTLQELVEREAIPYQIIGIAGHTRECFVVSETATNQQFRFGTPGPTLSPAEADACLAHLQTMPSTIDYLVVSGSLPPGLPTDFYAQIARWAKTQNIRLVLDTAGEPLRLALQEGVFLIKPNLGELARLIGVDQLETDHIQQAAMDLIRAGSCQVVVVSLGPRGAVLVTNDERWLVPSPPVKKVSTVGAGDSLVGGLVYALSQGKSYHDALRQGVACGTAATMHPGTQLFQADDVERLVHWIISQQASPILLNK